MLKQSRTIAASVTKLVIFYKIAVGKLIFIALLNWESNWEATNRGQPQESNSGDEDFTCMSIHQPKRDDIGLPIAYLSIKRPIHAHTVLANG